MKEIIHIVAIYSFAYFSGYLLEIHNYPLALFNLATVALLIKSYGKDIG